MCWGRPTINAVRHCGYIVYEGMYVSKPPDYAICQTLRVFYMWKYVHVEANWQRHLSDIKSLLYVKLCTCRHHLTTQSVRHWESFICESMYMSTPTDAISQTLRVFYMWKYVHVDAICQTLRVFYLWKYDNFEAVWQRPLSDISSLLLCESMFMLRPSDDSRCQNLRVRLYPPFVNNVSHLLSFLQYKCSYSLHWSLNNLFLYLFALTILCLRCISEFKMLYLVLMISEYWHGP